MKIDGGTPDVDAGDAIAAGGGNGASWKHSFREVPKSVLEALSTITDDLVIVAATKKVLVSEIAGGVYRHLGLRLAGAAIASDSSSVVPSATVGKYSGRNVNGWEVVRKDLPKITKTFTWETPNFGDASTYGTHTHYQDREVYQRQCFEPRHLAVSHEVLKQQEGGAAILVKFAVVTTLDRTRSDFDHDLLFCLNLLQENTGVAGVYPSTASRQDFMGTIALDWEIFPPGTAAEVIAALSGGRGFGGNGAGIVADRVKLFATLKPKAYLRGTGSFDSYVGAQFADDLVVFENVTYGNALYVLYDGWSDVSRRSRLDLLKGTTERFDRFTHVDGWEERFVEHMRGQLDEREVSGS